MLDKVTLETAREQVETTFQLRITDAESIDLKLVSAEDKGSTDRQQQFALTFTGPLEPFLPQRIYRLEHQHFGPLDLFLVPVARNADGFTYEAYFNRLVRERV